MKIGRFIGAILLIAGTSIGAGMLAMPVVTSFTGFYPSLLLMLLCWFFLLISAFFFLDVNLAITGKEVNMITMSEKTLGVFGKIISWGVYLLLLYALTTAYLAASAPIFETWVKAFTPWTLPSWLAPWPLLIIFGIFIYLGTKSVDYINRLLMLGLFVGYLMLVGAVPEHIQIDFLKRSDFRPFLLGLPILITSFGFHIIIPSLTKYLERNVKYLRLAIIIGSFIPFLIYAIWEMLVLGSVPLSGDYGLMLAWKKGEAATFPLMHAFHSPLIETGATLFSFFAIVTSFLGVSMALMDFLIDGLKIKRTGKGKTLAILLTFIPPLLFVYSFQRVFFAALEYAGAFVALLLGIMPALMARKIIKDYKSFKGKLLIWSTIAFFIFVILVDILS